MYKLKLKTPYTGERYGIMFMHGEGQTANEYLAMRLKHKGIEVEKHAKKTKGEIGYVE